MIEGFAGDAIQVLLAGDHPVLATLREQFRHASVRETEASDFGLLVDLWVEDSAPALEAGHRFAIDDVFGRVEGLADEVGFQLHLVRGRIRTLEAWTSRPRFPDDPRLVETWYVGPDPEPEAAEWVRVADRDVEFAVRGIHGDPGDD